jgi:hypothetical protein
VVKLAELSQERLDFMVEELDRRQDLITRICELQNLASAAGFPAMATIPFKMDPASEGLFQSSLALIQDACFRLTEPSEPRS